MFSKPINTQVIFALALAILMAWAGHASVLSVGAAQTQWSSGDSSHPHAHHETFSCLACADHFHSSVTADHVHETPHLPISPDIGALPSRARPEIAIRFTLPLGPVFLIERPPRGSFVL